MRIIDKNKDYYDWLSHTEISDDSILFDRRNSEFLTKSGFCAEVQLKGIVEYDIDIERRGKSWKSYRHERSGAHYEIALVAGTNLFIMRLADLVHNEGFDENGRRREILSDFTPTVVCARKNYGWNGVPLGLFTLNPKWWNRRTRRMVSAWDANGAESWDNANLANVLFMPLCDKTKIPILSQTGIPAVIQPEQIFLGIEEYLSSKSNDRSMESEGLTDVDKAVNHGFDKRTSFRKM